MNRSAVDRIVNATLYEGYILYPYRPSSVKNQVRWTFGGVHPRAFSEASGGSEPWTAQTECLLRGDHDSRLSVQVRFLQLVIRTVGRLAVPAPVWKPSAVAQWTPVESLSVDGVLHRSWEEAVEREIDVGVNLLGHLVQRPVLVPVRIDSARTVEPLPESAGRGDVVGVVVREHATLRCEVELSAAWIHAGLARVTVAIRNLTDLAVDELDREAAMRLSLVSTHAILGVEAGRWLSLADPPEDAAEAARSCTNAGLWPVLVGDGEDDTVLASPLILEDHPKVAPESPGDLFDATEIDEILSLRILTLTDQEKAEMRAADHRAGAMLDRTEALSGEAMMRMHGTIRNLRPVIGHGDDT